MFQIIGPCRSGTTLLFDILAHDPHFKYKYCDILIPNLPNVMHQLEIHKDCIQHEEHSRKLSGWHLVYNPMILEEDSQHPLLLQFLSKFINHESLIKQANPTPFRLKWLKTNFPSTIIIAIVRHPAEIMFSALGKPNLILHPYLPSNYGYSRILRELLIEAPLLVKQVCSYDNPLELPLYQQVFFSAAAMILYTKLSKAYDIITTYDSITNPDKCIHLMHDIYSLTPFKCPYQIIQRIFNVSQFSYEGIWDTNAKPIMPNQKLTNSKPPHQSAINKLIASANQEDHELIDFLYSMQNYEPLNYIENLLNIA